MILGELIRQYRIEHDMNMQDFADKCGLSKAYISILERNLNPKSGKAPVPTLETIQAVSQVIGIPFNDIIAMLDRDQVVDISSHQAPLPQNIIPLRPMRKIPLLGRIACGVPILAEQNIEDYIDLPGHIHADYALTCQGDSMINAGIRDGDMVYIREQPEVETGQIAAVIVDEEEATLKRFYFDGSTIQLVAENPRIPPMSFPGPEIARVRVLGRAVAYTHIIE